MQARAAHESSDTKEFAPKAEVAPLAGVSSLHELNQKARALH